MPDEQQKEGISPEGEVTPEGLSNSSTGPGATQLRSELEEAQRERAQFRSLLQRVQADFSNYRKQVETEREESRRSAAVQLVLELLPLLDDLERVAAQAPQSVRQTDGGWYEGVGLVLQKFQATLHKVGVQPIDALGKAFDPWEHEAVSYQETDQSLPGTVVGEVRRGYKLHSRVLRPSLVVVARPSAKASRDTAGGETGRAPELPEKEI
ncbi:MAG: nucleotide exchange factor GrpE [Chloroflexi bacterium]|nr:nucleotide exchange factor GrpE [Chloroflexota bacterium]